MSQQAGMSQEEKTWGMLCHLSALSVLFTGFGFILGPLIVWLIKREQYPFVDDQGKESLNFQISMLIYGAIAGLLILVAIGLVLLPLIGLFDIIMVIVASIAASNGQYFRYPVTIRFLH